MDEKTTKRRPTPTKRRTAARQTVSRSEPMSRDELRQQKYLERRRKRRRNRIIGYSVAIVALIIAAVVLSITVFFKIGNIVVTGDEVYNSETVIEASKLNIGDNMFMFSKEEVSSAVEEALPYVESLAIKRSPTGKLTFIITAAKAVMAIDRGDSYVLLSHNCKVLEDSAEAVDEGVAIINTSPVVSTVAGRTAEFENASDGETLTRLEDILLANSVGNITQIDITDYSNIKLKYNMRVTLKIGTVSSFEEKLDFINATLTKLDNDEPNFSGTVDFTIENKAFINFGEDEMTTAPAEVPAQTDEAVSQETAEQPTETTTAA